MRVAQLVERRRFRLSKQEIPDPAPGEVQVKVRSVGICGSDLHSFSQASVGNVPNVYPMVLGHEPTGTVVSTGNGVTGWSPGDRAFLEPAIYCYHCEFCLSGHHNVCARLRFLSQPPDPGYFRDYVNLPPENLAPMPPGMGFAEGTLFEPLAVVVHSMKFAAVDLGDTAAVFGAGPIGLMTVICLKLSGAARVFAVEPVAERREMALRAGADAAIDPVHEDPGATILAETHGRGVDVSMDCAMHGGTLEHSIHVTRNAGRVVITGIPTEPEVTADWHRMRRKEIRLYNVRRSNRDTGTAIELLKAHPERFYPIITHHRPIEEIQAAFEQVEAYADGVGKLVIRLD